MVATRLVTKMASGREKLSNASGSHRSFALWSGMSVWPSIQRLAPEISSARSLDLAAMDMKLVAVN